jgi:hypothetical protein
MLAGPWGEKASSRHDAESKEGGINAGADPRGVLRTEGGPDRTEGAADGAGDISSNPEKYLRRKQALL